MAASIFSDVFGAQRNLQELFRLDDAITENVITSSVEFEGETFVSVGYDCIVAIFRGFEKLEYVTELEFEGCIQCMAWDPSGSCILVAQSNGIIHFVSREGKVILSHRVLSRKCFSLIYWQQLICDCK